MTDGLRPSERPSLNDKLCLGSFWAEGGHVLKGAFVFPGQGSQYVGMGRSLYDSYPIARKTFNEASDALDVDIARLCFEGPEEILTLTENAQPAIMTVSIAAARVLKEKGVCPHASGGLSVGEYAALVTAGAMDFKDAVRVVKLRGKFMQEAQPPGRGAMAAIMGLSSDDVVDICKRASRIGIVSPANFNCPGQVVVSGEDCAVSEAISLAKEAGAKKAVMLSVSAPFHCRLMDPARERLDHVLEKVEIRVPEFPVTRNVDGGLHGGPEEIRKALLDQVSGSVYWEACIHTLIGLGTQVFLEVGPKDVLAGFNRRIDKTLTTLTIQDREGLDRVLDCWEDLCYDAER